MSSSSDSQGAGYATRQATILLHRRLAAFIRKPFHLRLNTNRRTFYSCSVQPGEPLRISLHRCFFEAPDDILQAVGQMVHGRDSHALAICRHYVASYDRRHKRQSQALPPELRQTQGTWHDLAAISEEVNRRYFDGQLRIRITWGKNSAATGGGRRRRPKTIQFGSYDHSLDLIRIHRRLDAPDVPRYYLSFLIYHELLHKTLGCKVDHASGRRAIHHAEFLDQERRHECYDLARAWEKTFFAQWVHQSAPQPAARAVPARKGVASPPVRQASQKATVPPPAAAKDRATPRCEQLQMFDIPES